MCTTQFTVMHCALKDYGEGRSHVKCLYHTRTKGCKEAFVRDGYVCYLDCVGGFVGVCICPNSWSSVHQICAIFIYQSYLFVYI